MTVQLSKRDLFVLALAARYAEANADDVAEVYEDALSEGQEGKGIIILNAGDGECNLAGVVPDSSEYGQAADKLLEYTNGPE